MCSRIWKRLREHLAFSLKCSSALFLLLVSILVVACGASNTIQAPGTPQVTVTINLNQTFASPTPTMAAYSCGAWALNTTPSYNPNGFVPVYAKYVHSVNGNPQAMPEANAQAVISWPDGHTSSMNATTTQDGLAVFQVGMQPSALNHVVLINVTFTSQDGQHTCTTPVAFFTAIQVSPTASPSPSPSNNPNPSPTGGLPTFTPPGGMSPTPTSRFGR